MKLINGMEDYGSAPGGESIYKDNKGYYIIQWNPESQTEYKKYLSKKWKPDPNRARIILKCTSKNKGCKWVILNSKTKKKTFSKNKKSKTTTRRNIK
jgi:hypothetical protein